MILTCGKTGKNREACLVKTFDRFRVSITQYMVTFVEKNRLKSECKPRAACVNHLPEVSDPAIFFL